MVKVSGKGRPSSQRPLFVTLTSPEKLLKYLFQEEFWSLISAALVYTV